jgi:hypothetical protein
VVPSKTAVALVPLAVTRFALMRLTVRRAASDASLRQHCHNELAAVFLGLR